MSVARLRSVTDGNLLAYIVRQHRIPAIHAGRERSADGQDAGRPCRARRLGRLGERQQDHFLYAGRRGLEAAVPAVPAHGRNRRRPDALVYEEKDEKFRLEAYKTRSDAYIIPDFAQPHHQRGAVHSGGSARWRSGRCLSRASRAWSTIPTTMGDSFYIRVNDTGRNFRLVKAPVTRSRQQELAGGCGAESRRHARRYGLLQELSTCLYERERRAAADSRDRLAQRAVAED